MFWLLLVVVPLLAEGAPPDGTSPEGGLCKLPPSSKERFYVTTKYKAWYQQYQYKVPGLFDLGCVMYEQRPGKTPFQMYLTGNFSRAPGFPLDCFVKLAGINRINKTYDGVWQSVLSGLYNVVYSHKEFIMDHYCFLGYDVAQIFTTVKEPSDELMEEIWQVVDTHPEIDRSKLVKVVC